MIWYPSISDYIEAVCNPTLFFRTLKDIEVVRDETGKPFFISGSNSVIFKIKHNNELCYLKCFTKDNELREEIYNSIKEFFGAKKPSYIYDFEFISEELLSFHDDGSSFFVPVIMGKWVNGSPLGKVIKESVFCNTTNVIRSVANKFILIALDLLSKEYSHGDIKPDNIIVSDKRDLTLIDLDAMYTPNMGKTESLELGTTFYQHPYRDKSHFGKNTDDYSIAIILTSLIAIEEFPEMYSEYTNGDNIIFIPDELVKHTSYPAWRLKEAWREKPVMLKLLEFLESDSPYINNLERIVKAIAKERNIKKFTTNFNSIKNPDQDIDILIIRSNTGEFGYSEPSGNIILMPIYDDILPFSEGYGAVNANKKWGYIDHLGVNSNGFIYDKATPFMEGVAAVMINNKWGFIDKKMNMIIPLKFDDCSMFCEGLAAVSIGGLWGYIGKNGEFLINPKFIFAKRFKNSAAIVKTEEGFSVIDKKGNFITEDSYDIIYKVDKNKAEVQKNGFVFTIDLVIQK